MLDRITAYAQCLEEPERWAVATIIAVTGSTPSPVGTSMAVSKDLGIIGSLSGGCVESTAASLAQETIASGEPTTETFGPDGGRLGEVPLTCGGRIQVLIQPLATVENLGQLQELAAGDPSEAAELVRELPGVGRVIERRDASPRLILSGVHDVSFYLSAMAVQAGWRTDIVDVRPAFATPARVPEGVALHVGDPAAEVKQLLNERAAPFTAVCVMTHHPDLDVPVLDVALREGAGGDVTGVDFVGAMGSRRAQARRDAALAELGHSTAARARIRGPLGLDLGAEAAAETAVSMFAELVARKNRIDDAGARLEAQTGPITRRPRVQTLIQPTRAGQPVPAEQAVH